MGLWSRLFGREPDPPPPDLAAEAEAAAAAFKAAAPSWPRRDPEAVLGEALRTKVVPEPIRWQWSRSHFTTGPRWWAVYGDGRIYRGNLAGTRREQASAEQVLRAIAILVQERACEPEPGAEPDGPPGAARVADGPSDSLRVEALGFWIDLLALRGPRGDRIRASLVALFGWPE
jgi:hypothetical protein